MTERKMMVVGFLFHMTDVLLVQKQKPAWQVGLWNGVGGKNNPGELPMDAMMREFFEETRIVVAQSQWKHVARETGPDYRTDFYSARMPDKMMRPVVAGVNDAGEPLAWRDFRFTPQLSVVGNLRWLIPLALDWRNLFAEVDSLDDIKERASW